MILSGKKTPRIDPGFWVTLSILEWMIMREWSLGITFVAQDEAEVEEGFRLDP